MDEMTQKRVRAIRKLILHADYAVTTHDLNKARRIAKAFACLTAHDNELFKAWLASNDFYARLYGDVIWPHVRLALGRIDADT